MIKKSLITYLGVLTTAALLVGCKPSAPVKETPSTVQATNTTTDFSNAIDFSDLSEERFNAYQNSFGTNIPAEIKDQYKDWLLLYSANQLKKVSKRLEGTSSANIKPTATNGTPERVEKELTTGTEAKKPVVEKTKVTKENIFSESPASNTLPSLLVAPTINTDLLNSIVNRFITNSVTTKVATAEDPKLDQKLAVLKMAEDIGLPYPTNNLQKIQVGCASIYKRDKRIVGLGNKKLFQSISKAEIEKAAEFGKKVIEMVEAEKKLARIEAEASGSSSKVKTGTNSTPGLLAALVIDTNAVQQATTEFFGSFGDIPAQIEAISDLAKKLGYTVDSTKVTDSTTMAIAAKYTERSQGKFAKASDYIGRKIGGKSVDPVKGLTDEQKVTLLTYAKVVDMSKISGLKKKDKGTAQPGID